ncbi:putative beta-glucosidase I 5 [Colletotrichum chlorophyti]|uniref:Probable beta-glucosidase I n=1 Tax=Colletotrichum chlorophyti TaxID=708187 RepID=A0A1Q8S753_9PEZI|nr:putative beta-glucosidase I 5 [Colletotrichum chlorophyti]
MAGAIIARVQGHGIASSLKHFVANDMEHQRTLVDCLISPRALREIYLLPFQLAIRDANPWALMTAYNRVNGLHMCENDILQTIGRTKWEYDGCIMSDWFGTYSTVESINSGLDLEMPGPTEWRGKRLATALSVGKISNTTLDERVASVLNLMERRSQSGIPSSGPEIHLNLAQDRDVLRQLAADSIVMLKNESNVLPLDTSKKIVVIGPNLKRSFYCGGGSAYLRPYRSISIIEALGEQLQQPVAYTEGCQIYNMLPVLGDLISAPKSGKKGHFQMDIYTAPPSHAYRTLIETLELHDTNVVLYDYNHAAAPDNILYATITADFVAEHTDRYDFGVTVAGKAQLFLDGVLVVDNATKQTRGESFFGSGSVEETGYADLEAGKAGAPVFGAGGVRFGCARRCDEASELERAVGLAKTAEQVVICVGLGPEWESEGADRQAYALPGRQSELISRVCAVNSNVTVVIQSGNPVAGPWDDVPAVLQSWYGGNESGHGLVDVLLGRRSPNGKLPLSWPRCIEDNPSFLSYRSEAGRCFYSEDIYVGYRFYEKTKRSVQWPFGHGLSYASFSMDRVQVSTNGTGLDGYIEISVAVTNTSSSRDGGEVIQAYVKRISQSLVGRPTKELKGFAKVFLPAGETRVVHISIPLKYGTSIWDEMSGSWLMERGDYQVLVGNSSASTPLVADFHVPYEVRWKGL